MTWNLTMNDWLVMSRCNRVAMQLFGKNHREANKVAGTAYHALTINGIPPEDLRDRRAPGMSDQRRLRKWKQLKAKGLIAGA